MIARRTARRTARSTARRKPSSSRRCAALTALLALACSPSEGSRTQGYIEGEFVYVASPRSGALVKLEVEEGARVEAGDALFTLDNMPEEAARDAARQELERARAQLEDARKGARPSELAAAEAALREARAALELSEKEAEREERMLSTPGATTEHDVDRARSARAQDRERVAQLEAELETEHLGAREDEIAAAEAALHASEAALARAEWELAEKRQVAPAAGTVVDTLYREGEWVAAGLPVVMLLPPSNVKLRAFVSEARLGALRLGDTVRVFIDGAADTVKGKISNISPEAEFTPPVVYSRDNRRKFVFLVEAVFEPDVAVGLHPGQPVEVELAPREP